MTKPTGLHVSKLAVGACALALGACAPGAAKPTTDLPIAAPEGASELVIEFIEICSAALSDSAGIGGLLAERGWQAMPGPDDYDALAGVLGAEHAALGVSLQVIPLDYPHVKGTGCSIHGYQSDNLSLTSLSGLDQVPGFLGGFKSFGSDSEATHLGRWSAIAPDGEPITITAMLMPDTEFLNLSMNHARRVQPDADT